ncbi:MAG: glutamate racemase [Anaerolineae bacterium]
MMFDANGSLGVFDSGVGGLSVVRALRQTLPHESILYVADGVNCPYGPRPAKEITELSEGISRYLMAHGAKVIVVACNTASAAALTHLRQVLPGIPFVGMVPAVKPAAQITRSGVVGVLATPGTLHGKLYEDVISHHAADVRVISSACPGLVELIEAGETAGARVEALLQDCLDPLLAAGVDTLVLGCTHYPFIIPTLNRMYPGRLTILEPSDAVSRQVVRVLTERSLLSLTADVGNQVYLTTGSQALVARALQVFLDYTGPVGETRWHNGVLVDGGECAHPI